MRDHCMRADMVAVLVLCKVVLLWRPEGVLEATVRSSADATEYSRVRNGRVLRVYTARCDGEHMLLEGPYNMQPSVTWVTRGAGRMSSRTRC